MVPENLEIECFHSNVLIPFLFKTPIPMIHGLIPPPKHTAILLLWFSQHDEGQGYVLMNMEFLKSCQFTVCLYENETWTQSQMSIASGGLKVLVLVIL